MANFLEYILSLKDMMSPTLKGVGVSAASAKQKIAEIEQKAGVGLSGAFRKVALRASEMRKKVSAAFANIGQKVDEVQLRISGFASRIGNTLRFAGGMIAGAGIAAGGMAVMQMFSGGKELAEQYNLSLAQVKASLESTGGSAGVSMELINAGMEKLYRTSNYTEADILSLQSVLLTFPKIGKDAFNETSQVALDMSAKLGQDLKGSAIQLGKALQDPVLGVTALRRVGVNFSQSQTDVIKNLVETGQQAKAQGMILAELNREFGGSAKAAFDRLDC